MFMARNRRGGGPLLQEIQVRGGGGVKKLPHLSWGCGFFFWNNSILTVEGIVKQLICVRTLIFNEYIYLLISKIVQCIIIVNCLKTSKYMYRVFNKI